MTTTLAMMILFNHFVIILFTMKKTRFDYPVVINMFTSIVPLYTEDQGCTNPERQVARATKSSALLRVIFVGPQSDICFKLPFWR
jgi:hypothetical protein